MIIMIVPLISLLLFHSIMNGSTLWSYNGKSLYPGISWVKPTFAEFRITSIIIISIHHINFLHLRSYIFYFFWNIKYQNSYLLWNVTKIVQRKAQIQDLLFNMITKKLWELNDNVPNLDFTFFHFFYNL